MSSKNGTHQGWPRVDSAGCRQECWEGCPWSVWRMKQPLFISFPTKWRMTMMKTNSRPCSRSYDKSQWQDIRLQPPNLNKYFSHTISKKYYSQISEFSMLNQYRGTSFFLIHPCCKVFHVICKTLEDMQPFQIKNIGSI